MSEENLKPIVLECITINPSTVDASKNPILYLHTIGSCKELWPLEELKDIANRTKRRSFVLDARCHGDTEHTAEFSLNLIVEDLKQFLMSKEYKQAVIVGHGFGGVSACLFALKYPEMVEMLVNVEGALAEEEFKKTSEAASGYIEAWATHVKKAKGVSTMEELVKLVYEKVYEQLNSKDLEPKEKFYKFKHPIVKKEDDSYDVKHNVQVIKNYLDKCAKAQGNLSLDGTYAGPALFVMAKGSEADKSLDPAIKKKFTNLVTKSLENTTHHIHLLFPELFVETLMTFHDNPPKA